MVKPEWGAKRTCPKCGTRFYDLGKDDPVVCVECGTNFEPDLILKSKQPLPFDAPKPSQAKSENSDDLVESLDVDEEEEPNADDDVDLGGDDDIGVDTGSEDEDQ
ncbi:TIGR02300 family protein [Sphingomonas sp.]|uniref:TIGR02300 family protein n=1 Tax=Sphingomonas sp. TaxID=28214 RepID=UPI000DB53AB5|nr:TIGR02300 family protein [Sphingomonas sp.]PZU08274.1 MAG: TIGR02300 family protein [Sphingomonas sp.]